MAAGCYRGQFWTISAADCAIKSHLPWAVCGASLKRCHQMRRRVCSCLSPPNQPFTAICAANKRQRSLIFSRFLFSSEWNFHKMLARVFESWTRDGRVLERPLVARKFSFKGIVFIFFPRNGERIFQISRFVCSHLPCVLDQFVCYWEVRLKEGRMFHLPYIFELLNVSKLW